MIEYNKRNARSWSIMGMKPSIWSVGFSEILKTNHENTYLLTADLERHSGLSRVASVHPEIFYNVGISEQNMAGKKGGGGPPWKKGYIKKNAPLFVFKSVGQKSPFI